MRAFILSLSIVAVLGAQTVAPNSMPAEQVKKIADTSKKDASKKVTILDVREEKELVESGMIEGAVHIPLGQLESRMSEIPKDRPVLAVCARGVRASKAAALLEKNGYKTQGVFGMKSWEENKYPVIYPKPAAGTQK